MADAGHNNDSRGPQLLSINIAFGVVAVITVILRTYTRLFIVKAFGGDDWFALVATVRGQQIFSRLHKVMGLV